MNSPSRINYSNIIAGLMVLLCSMRNAQAQTHTNDVLLQMTNSQLTTSGGSYAGDLNGRVFESTMISQFGAFATNNPGFDSAAGLLQSGEKIRFDFVREVLYWNGTALTTSPHSLTVTFGSTSTLLSPTDYSGNPGFEIAGGDASGAFHQHLWFSVPSGSPAGGYGAIMTLGPSGASAFGETEPFLIAFRRGATNLSPTAGVDAMAAALVPVPEPTGFALVAGAAAAFAATRCCGRMRKKRYRNEVAKETELL